jgi:hypothetical protein
MKHAHVSAVCSRKDPLYHVTAYEGMTETLETLKERGVKLAVCTNKPHPAALGAIYGIYGENLFDMIQGQVPEIETKASHPVCAADCGPVSGREAGRVHVRRGYGHGHDHRQCGGNVYYRGAVGLSPEKRTGGKPCGQNYRASVRIAENTKGGMRNDAGIQ